VYRGSFTRAGAKQAVLAFSQCKENDPNATWDAGSPGSAMVVEENAGRWKAVAFEDAVNTQACILHHRADGRDVLVCQSGFGAGSAGSTELVFVLDFTRKREPSLVALFSDGLVCAVTAGGAGPLFPSGFASARILDVKLVDVDKDGAEDVVVRVRRARVPPSAALEARVASLCKRSPQTNDGSALLPASKDTTLELLNQADAFVASPATRKTLDAWTAEAPPSFNALPH
jgi:hypothetical protein